MISKFKNTETLLNLIDTEISNLELSPDTIVQIKKCKDNVTTALNTNSKPQKESYYKSYISLIEDLLFTKYNTLGDINNTTELITLKKLSNLAIILDKRTSEELSLPFSHISYSLNLLVANIDEKLDFLHTAINNKNNSRREIELSKIQSKLTSEFNEKIQVIYSEALSNFSPKIEKQIDESNKIIKDEINKFDEINKQLQIQLNLVTNETLSNRNIHQAEDEKKTADKLRTLGIFWFSILSIISLSYFCILLFTKTDHDLTMLIFRWLVLLLLTIPGVYILKESSRHRSDERKYRKLGVQLATIDAYLSTFDDKEKIEIKKSLLSNFFSSEETKIDFSSVPDLLKTFEKVQDTILSIASKQSTHQVNSNRNETTTDKKKEELPLSSVS